MTDEKELLYLCDICDKKVGVVFVVLEDKKRKDKCTKCFYGKNNNKN